MLVIDGWENSNGTVAEIELAESLSMPVFYSLNELIRYASWFDRK